MNEILALTARLRTEYGTGAAKKIRNEGMVPAVIYGFGKDPISIAIEEKEITKYYRKPQYISQLFEFDVEGKKYKALPKDIQLDPVTEIVRHADFILLGNKTHKMKVPIIYKNKENSVGVKRGGYFNTIRRFLNVLCSVDNLPRKIEIDTINTPISTSIRAKEAKLPEGTKLLDDPEIVIASIIGRKGKASDSDEEKPAENNEETKEDSK